MAIYRTLTRAVVREVHRALVGRGIVTDYSNLRPARHATSRTLTTAATTPGVWPSRLSDLESGSCRDDVCA